jgi:steroid delta-isomerase
MPLADPRAAADRIVRWFETLTPDSLTGLDDCYTPDATFKDPFNEVNATRAGMTPALVLSEIRDQ